MTVDLLATRLKALLEEGAISATRLSRLLRAKLAPLFDVGVLVQTTGKGPRRVEVRDRPALVEWIAKKYPAGLDGVTPGLPPRAASVARTRNSKRGEALAARLVHMRGFGSTVLTRDAQVLPLATLTAAYGVVGIVVGETPPWSLAGRLAIVENVELFMHLERLGVSLDAALLVPSGRLERRLMSWLASQEDLQLLHFGDYDPVGLDEYLRLREVLGPRVGLHVPEDLELRVREHGQREILAKSAAVLERVRRSQDEVVLRVMDIVDRHGLGLEQEGLLIPLSRPSNNA
ncbi:MAG: DUF7281 domain-containing protein [Polyangiaceae bacterium]